VRDYNSKNWINEQLKASHTFHWTPDECDWKPTTWVQQEPKIFESLIRQLKIMTNFYRIKYEQHNRTKNSKRGGVTTTTNPGCKIILLERDLQNRIAPVLTEEDRRTERCRREKSPAGYSPVAKTGWQKLNIGALKRTRNSDHDPPTGAPARTGNRDMAWAREFCGNQTPVADRVPAAESSSERRANTRTQFRFVFWVIYGFCMWRVQVWVYFYIHDLNPNLTCGFCIWQVWVQVYFCIHDLNLNPTRAKPGLGAGFVFHPRVHPDPKKSEIRKKPEKTWNLKETQKKLETQKNPEEIWKKTERNPFTKPDGHPNPTRNLTGSSSGVKFHPRVQVQVINLIWLHFFLDQIFGRPTQSQVV
jgi:hypothetical protein